MKRWTNQKRLALFCMFGSLAVPASAEAQDGAFTWDNTTELSFVATNGNASSNTLGLKSTLIGTGAPNTFKFEVGGIRAESKFTTRTAVGTIDNFNVNEASSTEVIAENYFARSRFDRDMGTAFLFTGAGWDRNTFAGIDNRYAFVLGLGRTWVEGESARFKTDIGATYTIQKDVDPAPGADEGFGGFRITVDGMKQLSTTTQYQSLLIIDDNLENTSDYRADWTNSISVTVTDGLALKTSLQLLYDNTPSLIGVPLQSAQGVLTGDSVLTPSNDLDSIFTVALVIKL